MNVRCDPVLVIEDDENDRLLIARAFSKAKFANPLYFVVDGEEALRYLHGSQPYENRELPGIILLDLRLPKRSGLDVLAWLRAQPGLRHIPVVVLTSSQDSGDMTRAYDLGVNSYLVKPVEFGELQNMTRLLGVYWLALNQAPGAGDSRGMSGKCGHDSGTPGR